MASSSVSVLRVERLILVFGRHLNDNGPRFKDAVVYLRQSGCIITLDRLQVAATLAGASETTDRGHSVLSGGDDARRPAVLDPAAKEIVERLLAQTGEAIMGGDFSLMAPCFILPQDAQIFDTGVPINTLEDLRMMFKGVRETYADLGVTKLVRPCTAAEFHDADTIFATHMTYLLAGEVLLREPYPVFSVFKRQDAGWMIANSVYATTSDMASPDWAFKYVKRTEE